jgi:hypothetical protein
MTEKVICPISKSEAEATTSACLMVLGFVAKLTVNLRSQMAHWQCTKTQKLRAGRALLGAQRTGRNVVANYPFERSHRFPGIKPNSGHRDYSPLSCGGGETQLGPSAEIDDCQPGSPSSKIVGGNPWPSPLSSLRLCYDCATIQALQEMWQARTAPTETEGM